MDNRRLTVLRFVAVAGQAATVLVTWRLWQVRDYPPLIPAASWVPQFSVGLALLVSLAVALVRPRIGAVLHSALLVYAMVGDLTRIQPEVISLAVLIVATTGWSYGPDIGRVHLISVWFWSGANKLLSTGYLDGGGAWILRGLPFGAGRPHGLALIVAFSELAVGVVLLVPRLRRAGVVGAALIHTTILYVLVIGHRGWNEAVWPWNLVLIVAAFVLFWRPAHDLIGRRARLALVSAALVFPVGFHLGVLDAYPTHNLYSTSLAHGYVCHPGQRLCSDDSFQATWDFFHVPLPPEPRVYRYYFARTCSPGDRLVVEPRRVRFLLGANTQRIDEPCPSHVG